MSMETELSAMRGLRNVLFFSICVWALILGSLAMWLKP